MAASTELITLKLISEARVELGFLTRSSKAVAFACFTLCHKSKFIAYHFFQHVSYFLLTNYPFRL